MSLTCQQVRCSVHVHVQQVSTVHVTCLEISGIITIYVTQTVIHLKCKFYIDLLKISSFAISGREIGKYLALDLGGTNFRVLLLGIKANPLI